MFGLCYEPTVQAAGWCTALLVMKTNAAPCLPYYLARSAALWRLLMDCLPNPKALRRKRLRERHRLCYVYRSHGWFAHRFDPRPASFGQQANSCDNAVYALYKQIFLACLVRCNQNKHKTLSHIHLPFAVYYINYMIMPCRNYQPHVITILLLLLVPILWTTNKLLCGSRNELAQRLTY